MERIVSRSCYCHHYHSLFPGKSVSRRLPLDAAKWRQFPSFNGVPKAKAWIVKAQVMIPPTFSSGISIDIPFDEAPQASFDQYLDEKPRVFQAILPERQGSRRLNEDEWRIYMLPMHLPHATVYPVVDMRLNCISNASKYPPDVPRDTSKVLELEIIRWELRGLGDILRPSQFSIEVQGSLYTDRKGAQSRLRGRTQLSIGFSLPPAVALVAGHVCQDVASSILWRLVESLKQTVNTSLLEDYTEFKRERLKQLDSSMD